MELSGRPKKQNVLTWSQTPNDCMKSNKKLKSLEKYYLIEFRPSHLPQMFLCIKYIAGKTLHKIFGF